MPGNRASHDVSYSLDAIQWAEKSLELLGPDGDPELCKHIESAIRRYQAQQPMR